MASIETEDGYVSFSGKDLSSLDALLSEDTPSGDVDAVTLSDVKDTLEVTNGLLGYIFAEILFLFILLISMMLYRLLHHNVTKFIH